MQGVGATWVAPRPCSCVLGRPSAVAAGSMEKAPEVVFLGGRVG